MYKTFFLTISFILIVFKGWSEWSNYTACNEDGEKVRYRKCLKANPGPDECVGAEKETKICKMTAFNGNASLLIS